MDTQQKDTVPGSTPSPREQAEKAQEHDLLQTAINELPKGLREVVLLRFSEDLAAAEIARRLGMNRSSVSRRLDKALATLRGSLTEAPADERRLVVRRGAVARTTMLVGALAAAPGVTRAAVVASAGPVPAEGFLVGGKTLAAAHGVVHLGMKSALTIIGVVALGAVAVYQHAPFSVSTPAGAPFGAAPNSPRTSVSTEHQPTHRSVPISTTRRTASTHRAGAVLTAGAGGYAAASPALGSAAGNTTTEDIDIIVESGTRGNHNFYTDTASQGQWQDSDPADPSTKSTARGVTGEGKATSRVYVVKESTDATTGTGTPLASAQFRPSLNSPQHLFVYVTWPRAANVVPVQCTVHHAKGTAHEVFLQDGFGAKSAGNADTWTLVGDYDFSTEPGQGVEFSISAGAIPVDLQQPCRFVADAVRFVQRPLAGGGVLIANSSEEEAMEQSARSAAATGLKSSQGGLIMPPAADGKPFPNPNRWARIFFREVAKPGTITGKVIDENRKPVAEATVQASLQFSGARSASADATPVLTGADGTFTIAEVPLGPYELSVTKAGFAGSNNAKVELTTATSAAHPELPMRTQSQLRGVVIAPDGRPVAGVELVVAGFINPQGELSFSTSYAKMKATTDAAGVFQIGVDQDGLYNLRVEPKEEYTNQIVYDVPIEKPDVTIHLTKGATISGRVLSNASGTTVPAAGHTVFAKTDSVSYSYLPTRSAVTDADGLYTIDRLNTNERAEHGGMSRNGIDQVREWTLVCQNATRAVKPKEGAHLQGIDLLISEESPWANEEWSLSGSVVDARTSQPIENFRTELNQMDMGEVDGNYMEWPARVTAGKYRVPKVSPNGGLQVRVSAPGYASAESPILHSKAREMTYDFALKPSAGIRGKIVGPDGKPAQGVDVYLYDPQDLIDVTNGSPRVASRSGGGVAKTDALGKFHLESHTEPYLLMVFDHTGFGQMYSGEFKSAKEIKLIEWAVIEGTSYDKDRPVSDQEIRMDSEEFRSSLDRTKNHNQIIWDYSTKTDQAGKFVFDRVKPGTVDVGRAFRMPSTRRGSYSIGTSHNVEVDARSGQTTKVDIGRGGAVVTGRIVWKGNPSAELSRFRMKIYEIPQPRNTQHSPGLLSQLVGKLRGGRGEAAGAGTSVHFVRSTYYFNAAEDGTFKVSGVKPGKYAMHIDPDPDGSNRNARYHRFTVPSARENTSNTLDLGAFEPTER